MGQVVKPRVARSRLTLDWYFRCRVCCVYEGARSWRHAMGLLHAHLLSERHVNTVAARAEVERAERILREPLRPVRRAMPMWGGPCG